MLKKMMIAVCCCLAIAGLDSCGTSYKLSKDYATRDTFGFLVFVSQSGKTYDDLWVNISGLNKTFLATSSEIVDGEVKGMRYGAQQGTRSVMVRKQNERLLYQDIVDIRAGETTIIKLND